MKSWLKTALILAIFLSISAYVNFRSETIPDPDSFYHIRHAWIYQTNGIFDSSFPWTQFSTIRTMGADLWYGFHIFLIPLTSISDLSFAIKIAAFLITFLFLVSVYTALKNIKIELPELWTIFFLLSSPSIITRMTMTRPHPLSLGLIALIFSYFYKGPAILVLIFSFILSWIHSSVFWFPIIAAGVLMLIKRLNNQQVEIYKFTALLGGIVTGLMARPHPLANLKLIYIQIVDLYLAKGYELAQTIGAELRPPTWESIYTQKWLFAIFLIALIYMGRLVYKKIALDPDKKIIIWSSLILALLSLSMYATAKRAIDYLGLFIMTFVGLAFSCFLSSIRRNEAFKKRLAIIIVLSIIAGLSIYNISHMDFSNAQPPDRFKEPAMWLKENTNEKDIVFYLYWGYFPSLFFWNQHNYYIYGMDPVFLLKYDKKLYWKIYNLATKDTSGFTCGYEPKQCGSDDLEPVSDMLRNDFHASYVFIRQLTKTKFGNYLEEDKENFEKVYEKENILIFRILPPPNN